MDEQRVVRAHLGYVTHADGTMTSGLHVRDAQGVLTVVDVTEATLDGARVAWVLAEAHRRLCREDACDG